MREESELLHPGALHDSACAACSKSQIFLESPKWIAKRGQPPIYRQVLQVVERLLLLPLEEANVSPPVFTWWHKAEETCQTFWLQRCKSLFAALAL